jgi:hypothetical protein
VGNGAIPLGAEMVRLIHKCSTRREGVMKLISVSIVAPVFWGILAYIAYHGWHDYRLLIVGGFAFLSLVTAAAVTYAVQNIVANGEFICQLDEETIECRGAAKGCGESFKINIADIRVVERVGSEAPCQWYIWDKNNRRYLLTINYKNPADKFICEIRKMKPSIVEI